MCGMVACWIAFPFPSIVQPPPPPAHLCHLSSLATRRKNGQREREREKQTDRQTRDETQNLHHKTPPSFSSPEHLTSCPPSHSLTLLLTLLNPFVLFVTTVSLYRQALTCVPPSRFLRRFSALQIVSQSWEEGRTVEIG